MRDLKNLRQFWTDYSAETLILCTLVGKQGSGYRSLGAKKIIRPDGNSCGSLSGGCLEGDITRFALENLYNMPAVKSFSTLSEEDRLLGYQTGCAGAIDILYERLPGILRMDEFIPYGVTPAFAGVSVVLHPENLGERKILETITQPSDSGIFIDSWVSPVQLVIIGCGPNTLPFAELALPLGWEVLFIDYRKDHEIKNIKGVDSIVVAMEKIGATLPEGPSVAVVVATNNYEADLQIMSQLNKREYGYLGCIGPRKRLDSIIADMPKFYNLSLNKSWAGKIKAPAGLHKADTPEAIAFSVIAEIQFSQGVADD